MKTRTLLISISLVICRLIFCQETVSAREQTRNRHEERIRRQLKSWTSVFPEWGHLGAITLDSVALDPGLRFIDLFFSQPLSFMPVRESTGTLIRESVRELVGRRYRDLEINIHTSGRLLEELIPNAFRNSLGIDSLRFRRIDPAKKPLLRKADGRIFSKGLDARNIAVWPSHGWYYESKQDRWKWQRPRLFSTVEDLFTRGFVLPYLVPMLENSGAAVWLPVERDTQTMEFVGDNDGSSEGTYYLLPASAPHILVRNGFKYQDTILPGNNPFLSGTSLQYAATPGSTDWVAVGADFQTGSYAVYFSWQTSPNSSDEVLYEVVHAAGTTPLFADQTKGGGTWIYAGTYRFNGEDYNGRAQGVYISLSGKPGTSVSVDAVRFGGGMGNVARRPAGSVIPNAWSLTDGSRSNVVDSLNLGPGFSWKTSGRPRYMEGARYYLQYAGFPDTLVYNLNNDRNDYNDDYMSRGEWVNYLVGNPSGPQKDRSLRGLGIPVDLALAFHTDAGITPAESVIGTLAIYSTWADAGMFPDGMSRMASRDLSDLVQSQIVDDLRALYNPAWSRRGMWDRQYSEAWRPNVPVMLLELLSHQNLADMQYGLDPRFRFAAGRAIYKGMAKFLASSQGREYVIQPLPPDHFAISRLGDDELLLSWQQVSDPLEPSAVADSYHIYQSLDDRGFARILEVEDTFAIIRMEDRQAVYKFRITAVNEGGESFPTEVLSARLSGRKGTGLVVNGFDRISGPAWLDAGGKAGIAWWHDLGVADGSSFMHTGDQYNYDRNYPWMDDDNPGWGSSHSDSEGFPRIGNSFDYTAMHGMDLFGVNGYSWVSVSDEVFVRPDFDATSYFAVDIILGEEVTTPSGHGGKVKDFTIYTPAFMNKIRSIADAGGNLLLSGAHVGTDLTLQEDSAAIRFAWDVTGFAWRTNHATLSGRYEATEFAAPYFRSSGSFNQKYHPGFYMVESPDGIIPAGQEAFAALRYYGNSVGAAVALRRNYRSIVMGFPVESMVDASERRELLREVMHFFESDRGDPAPFFSARTQSDSHGAMVRGDNSRKNVYLFFSGDEHAEGFGHVLDVLSKKNIRGYFFLTGNFLRNPDLLTITGRIIREGHYLGPHSDKHLLYVPWSNRDSLLVTHSAFMEDLNDNIREITGLGVDPDSVTLFLAPYEWYNRLIADWTREAGLRLVNFTPGTGTNADYTTPDMSNYRSSEELMDRLVRFEKSEPGGLSGAILLIHPGTDPARKDKFYLRLEELIEILTGLGYNFK